MDDLKVLNQEQVKMIDEALVEIGDFGEVRVVVNDGKFRFLILQKSFDAINMTPRDLIQEFDKKANKKP